MSDTDKLQQIKAKAVLRQQKYYEKNKAQVLAKICG